MYNLLLRFFVFPPRMCFQVFEPIIGSDLKLSAEDIEKGLINPDSSLAKLHVTLLKVLDCFTFSLVHFFRILRFFAF